LQYHFNVLETRQNEILEQFAANTTSADYQQTSLIDLFECLGAQHARRARVRHLMQGLGGMPDVWKS
jgi:hypothetical protein